jgi:hypothetical protein
MEANIGGAGRGTDGRLQAAIDRLTDALAALDDVGVPLACAYVDLALSLCREELAQRGQEET